MEVCTDGNEEVKEANEGKKRVPTGADTRLINPYPVFPQTNESIIYAHTWHYQLKTPQRI